MPHVMWVFRLCLSICAIGLLGCGGEEPNPFVEAQCGTAVFEAGNCNIPADVQAKCVECVESFLKADNENVNICGTNAWAQGCEP